METYIKGTFKRKIYSSNDGYVVGLVKINETNDDDLTEYVGKQFTFTGLFATLNIDENYTFYGNVVDNARYGFQYHVNRYEKLLPEDKDGLVIFLSSDIFPGVGEKTAKQIVDVLGDDCLNLISNDYECLLKVPKMTVKKASDIHSKLLKYNESFEVVVYLTNLGFSMKDALKIYNHYLEDTIRVIKNNPYELIDTVDGINFFFFFELRSKIGIDVNDEKRILALILYVMKNLCFQTGDTYLNLDLIYNAVASNYDEEITKENLTYYLIQLNSMGKIIIDSDKYILIDYYKFENYVAEQVYEISSKEDAKVDDIELKIDKLESYFNINYNEEQKRAIKQSLIKNFSIITGGPGTGKTTIIKGIVQLYKIISGYSHEKLEEKLVLLAPTGRAAKRMSEACNFPASTIHRYLRWNKETNEFGYNSNNKAPCEFVIIDETSMIDIELLYNFFKAIKTNVKLVFIGDYNQLESVGPGNILKDLIDSQMINTIFLKEIYRQDQNSYITELAYEINYGELTESFLNKKDDYNFIGCDDENILKTTCILAKKAIDKGYDIKNVQVLAPVYKGINGIDNLNKTLQKIFNPKSDEKNETYDGNVIYREKDKVLQLENMPDDNVFNGDIGFIEKINGSEITVNFDGNKVKYTPKEYKNIKHGYAISIHKAQGSEFEIVLMPITNAYKMMLYRKIIYTGITRAKKSLMLIGNPKAFYQGVYNNGTKKRNTLLKDILINKI